MLEALDLEEMVDLLDRLVQVRSVGGMESPAQRLAADFMAASGLDVDTWAIDLDTLRHHPHFCEEIEREDALGVVGRLGSDEGPSLLFNGHLDVVGAGDESDWSVPPWRATVRDGVVFGRGTVDMKGGVCAAMCAAKALLAAGVRLQGRLLIAPVVGEEDGGTGTLAAIERGHVADAAVIMEPTRMRIATTHAGALNFRVRLKGLSAHACMREEGVSAVDKLPRLLAVLAALEQRRSERYDNPLFAAYGVPFPLSVGRVQAGDWPSSVPDWLQIEGRYGVAPGESLESARAEFEEALASLGDQDPWLAENPPSLEWWGGQFEPAEVDPGAPIVEAIADTYRAVSQRDAVLEGMTYGADMRLLVNVAGIPTVMFGAGDVRQAHRPDEFVPLDDLTVLAQTLCVTAMRFCGVET
ncbi:MAG TPA: ArgE/DapE family deacylase [Acidobacteriota bacterium]|nr:ArgE/DapE family deacylase [Acidobacteriota bacterium]